MLNSFAKVNKVFLKSNCTQQKVKFKKKKNGAKCI